MANSETSLTLTEEDKDYYREQINNIELDQKEQIISIAPDKVNALLRRDDLQEYQVTLLEII